MTTELDTLGSAPEKPSPTTTGPFVVRLEVIRGGRQDLAQLLGEHPRDAAGRLAGVLRSGAVGVEFKDGVFELSFPPPQLEGEGEETEEALAA